MNRATFRKIACLALVLAMLVSAVAMMTVTASAETVAVEKTAPEIVVKGNVDVWDKTTKTEPTQVADDGYILITSAAEFAWFMSQDLTDDTGAAVPDSANYRLTTSIDLGNEKVGDTKLFSGIFDGNGYTIDNFNNDGFFSFSTMSGTIKDLNIINMYVDEGNSKNTSFINLLTGTIDNCNFQYKTFALSRGGGVAHVSAENAVISNCTMSCVEDGFMKSGYHMGGFVCGAGGSTHIVNCTNYSPIKTSGNNYHGGIVADVTSNNVRIENCVNYGDISTTGSDKWGTYFGGIVGYIAESAQDGTVTKITNCINYGNITIPNLGYVGGIVGVDYGAYNNKYSVYYLHLDGCVNYGDITTGSDSSTDESCAGGLIGKAGRGLLVTNSVNYGDLSANGTKAFAGGVVGIRSNTRSGNASLIVRNTTIIGSVTSDFKAGGVAGQHNSDWPGGTSDEKNYYHGVHTENLVITGTITGQYAGGIMGYYTDGTYSTNIILKSTAIASTIVPLGDTTTAGALCGYSSYNRTDGRLCNSLTVTNECFINTNGLEIANTATSTGVVSPESNAAYAPSEYSESILTDGTILATLNASALANGQMPWVQGDTAPELLVCALELDGANLELSGDLVMNLRLDAADLPAGFTYSNVKLATADNMYEGIQDGNYYVFAVKDIPAAEMGTNRDYHIVVEITTGETTVSYKTLAGKSYSPVTYAQNICKRTDEEATKAQNLLQAMVKYAYYAEVMEDGTSAIIDNFNAATGLALTSDIGYTATVRDDVDVSNLGAYVSVGANLNAGVNLVFKVNDASVTALELTAGGSTKTYQAEGGYIEITDVHAGMLKNKLNIKLLAGDSEIVSATYAIGNYLDSVATSGAYTEAQQNAAMAAAMYMLAVGQYQTPAYYN